MIFIPFYRLENIPKTRVKSSGKLQSWDLCLSLKPRDYFFLLYQIAFLFWILGPFQPCAPQNSKMVLILDSYHTWLLAGKKESMCSMNLGRETNKERKLNMPGIGMKS